jgi:phosphoglucomutase
MAIDLAEQSGAEIVIGTDPDADRMGVAVRDSGGKMVLLTGNQIGSLMAWYRLKTCFELGWLTHANRSRAVLIKTFVTTELQRAIADGFGVGIVDTLTGFKYIAGKLRKYEDAIPSRQEGRLPLAQRGADATATAGILALLRVRRRGELWVSRLGFGA